MGIETLISKMFGMEKPPTLPTLPPPAPLGPTPEEMARQSEEALAMRKRRGRGSTILTGGNQAATTPQPGNLKTVLGA